MRYFTYHKDAGTSHCEKNAGGWSATFFFDLSFQLFEFNGITKTRENASEAKSIIILFGSFCRIRFTVQCSLPSFCRLLPAFKMQISQVIEFH